VGQRFIGAVQAALRRYHGDRPDPTDSCAGTFDASRAARVSLQLWLCSMLANPPYAASAFISHSSVTEEPRVFANTGLLEVVAPVRVLAGTRLPGQPSSA